MANIAAHHRALVDAVRVALEAWDVKGTGNLKAVKEHWISLERAMSDLRIALRLWESK